MKINSVLAWLALAMLLFLGGCSHTSYLESDTPEDDMEVAEEARTGENGAEEQSEEAASIFVQVAGAVKSPGVYELAQGARVFEAIELAGGLKKNADDAALNQASLLADGEKIYVYRVGEREEAEGNSGVGAGTSGGDSGSQAGTDGAFGGGISGTASGGSSGVFVGGKININTAGVEDLKKLSGIGDAKAQAIVSYREANGGFQSVDELTKVDGIGEATFQKLKEDITL